MKLTKEEEKLILDKRAAEEAEKPKKIGKLKEDLYMNNSLGSCGQCIISVPWICSLTERDEYVSEFFNSFEKVLSAGAVFDCYIEKDGRESWYDRDCGIEGIENLDAVWAKDYLTDIENV